MKILEITSTDYNTKKILSYNMSSIFVNEGYTHIADEIGIYEGIKKWIEGDYYVEIGRCVLEYTENEY